MRRRKPARGRGCTGVRACPLRPHLSFLCSAGEVNDGTSFGVTIRCARSGDTSDSKPADAREVLGVSRHKPQSVFNGRGRDQGIGETQSELSRDPTSPFGHGPVNEELAKRCEQFGRQVRRCIAREEFGSSDHRVVQSVTARRELAGATEVIDEDVCIDEKISHAANCHAPEQQRRVGHRTFVPERRRYRRHQASRRRALCERPLPSARPPRRSRRRCGGAARQ